MVRRVRSWRELARASIDAVVLHYHNAGHNLARLTPEEKEEIKRLINESYPFGGREYSPYKRWLEERSKVLFDLGIIQKAPDKQGRKTRKYTVRADPGDITPGQLSLW